MAETVKKYISKIQLAGVSEPYYLEDTDARADIAVMKTQLTGGIHFRGITTTVLTDGGTEVPTDIEGITAVGNLKAGDLVILKNVATGQATGDDNAEFIWNGAAWEKLGTAGALKALAYKDSASVTLNDYVTGVGTKTFTGTAATINATYTPSGTVAVDVSKSTIYQVTDFGTVNYTSQTISGGGVAYDGEATVAHTDAVWQLTGGAVAFPTLEYASQTISGGGVAYASTYSTAKASVAYTAPSFTLTSGAVTHTGATYTSQKISGGSVAYTSQTVSSNNAVNATVSGDTLVFGSATIGLTSGGAAYTSPTLTAGSVNFGSVTYTPQTVSGWSAGSVTATMPSLTFTRPTLTAGNAELSGGSYTSQTISKKTAGSVSVTMPSLAYTSPTLTAGGVTYTGATKASVEVVVEVSDTATFTGKQGTASASYTPSGTIIVALTKGNKTVTVS